VIFGASLAAGRGSCLTGDRGAGVFSTAFGVAGFVLFLFLAVQLLVNLFFVSSVTSAAHDAAAAAAHRGAPPDGRVLQEAEADFRQALGPTGRRATLEWDTVDPDFVELHVRVAYPELAFSGLNFPFFETLDRTFRVRIEQVRE
jgi:hypothetical protein